MPWRAYTRSQTPLLRLGTHHSFLCAHTHHTTALASMTASRRAQHIDRRASMYMYRFCQRTPIESTLSIQNYPKMTQRSIHPPAQTRMLVSRFAARWNTTAEAIAAIAWPIRRNNIFCNDLHAGIMSVREQGYTKTRSSVGRRPVKQQSEIGGAHAAGSRSQARWLRAK